MRPELAEDALAAIEVEFEQLAAVTDWASAKTGKVLLFETTGSNIASVFKADKGDPDTAFRQADVVVRDQFSTQRQTALPMETRGLLAEWDGGRQEAPRFGCRQAAVLQPQGDGEDDESSRSRRSIISKSTSAAASVRAVNSIRKTFSSPSRRANSAIR